jgi:hypothetical protein
MDTPRYGKSPHPPQMLNRTAAMRKTAFAGPLPSSHSKESEDGAG